MTPARAPTHVTLPSGILTVRVDRAEMPLGQLCGFAARRSRKRGFVFLSRILGKHYPVRPSLMDEVHRRLAAKLTRIDGPAVVVAMAETATALGHGVYEHLLALTGRDDLLFLQTTRYRVGPAPALTFEESHSHATRHLLHEPAEAGCRRLFRGARALVLVDDEISTGRTLVNLARAYRRLAPSVARLHLVCITDWLAEARRAELAAEVGVPVECHSLLGGGFAFEDNPEFDPGPIPAVDGRGDDKSPILPRDFGRLGLRGPLAIDWAAVAAGLDLRPGRVLVLGSGEFAYAPFRLALHLERAGRDVHYQSTTRSPLLVGNDITSAIEFTDNYHDDIANYLYNVTDRHHDETVIGYETRPLPAAHRLPELLGARAVFF
jgi:hypothetical protein